MGRNDFQWREQIRDRNRKNVLEDLGRAGIQIGLPELESLIARKIITTEDGFIFNSDDAEKQVLTYLKTNKPSGNFGASLEPWQAEGFYSLEGYRAFHRAEEAGLIKISGMKRRE